ncbi:inositol monophosphatase family protein [Nocardioides baekrokdamisoli]|nr:inositol monophosphatase family protein [Nocardioides baekrokdamisoli]
MNEELLALAQRAARATADLVRPQIGSARVAATKSSAVDVVTQVDRDSEALIRSIITAARPHDAIVGEEEDDRPGSSGVRWIVDPIDGTVNFLYNLPEFAVSIAVEVAGVTVAGVVINIPQQIEYAAVRTADGVRSTRNGQPISVRAYAPLAERLIATGFSYDSGLRALQGAAAAKLLPSVRDLRRHGAAALELCHVAEGCVDGYLEEGTNVWDYAAGALIAEGAGATVEVLTGSGGRTLVVAGPADGFDELLTAAQACSYVADPV